jgi:FkbH-like protein
MRIRREHLAGWRINWEPKPANLAALAQELNLGLDSFIFVDDSAAECEAVRRALPDVEVVELPKDPAAYAGILRRNPRLERLTLSSEDAERTRYYADERDRRTLAGSAGSLEDFLASLDIEAGAEPVSAATLARAAQLTQKTNQLNTTTRRYGEAELQQMLGEPAWRGYVLSARDRFGDNGVVGLALTRDDGAVCEIDTFLLSCRVIGRGLETAFLAHIAGEARERGAERLSGEFRPTPRNAPAARIYELAGFRLLGETADGQAWGLSLSDEAVVAPAWVRWTSPGKA